MAWQLVYTSAPRLFDAGRSGFGTVARHREIPPLIVQAVERFSQFARLPGMDPNRVIYTHRIIAPSGTPFHVFSMIRNAGSDYTGRTNHIAHHLIATESEATECGTAGITPADVLIGYPWLSSWEQPPRALVASDEVELAGIPSFAPQESSWYRVTGNPEHAWLLVTNPASRGCNLIGPVGTDFRLLFNESLRATGSGGWQVTFTTAQEPNDEAGDFRWMASSASSPGGNSSRSSGRPLLDLTRPGTLPQPELPQESVPEPTPDPSDKRSDSFIEPSEPFHEKTAAPLPSFLRNSGSSIKIRIPDIHTSPKTGSSAYGRVPTTSSPVYGRKTSEEAGHLQLWLKVAVVLTVVAIVGALFYKMRDKAKPLPVADKARPDAEVSIVPKNRQKAEQAPPRMTERDRLRNLIVGTNDFKPSPMSYYKDGFLDHVVKLNQGEGEEVCRYAKELFECITDPNSSDKSLKRLAELGEAPKAARQFPLITKLSAEIRPIADLYRELSKANKKNTTDDISKEWESKIGKIKSSTTAFDNLVIRDGLATRVNELTVLQQDKSKDLAANTIHDASGASGKGGNSIDRSLNSSKAIYVFPAADAQFFCEALRSGQHYEWEYNGKVMDAPSPSDDIIYFRDGLVTLLSIAIKDKKVIRGSLGSIILIGKDNREEEVFRVYLGHSKDKPIRAKSIPAINKKTGGFTTSFLSLVGKFKNVECGVGLSDEVSRGITKLLEDFPTLLDKKKFPVVDKDKGKKEFLDFAFWKEEKISITDQGPDLKKFNTWLQQVITDCDANFKAGKIDWENLTMSVVNFKNAHSNFLNGVHAPNGSYPSKLFIKLKSGSDGWVHFADLVFEE